MGISIKVFVNSVPKALLQKYFQTYPVIFENDINWELQEKELARVLEKAIKGLPKSTFDPLHLNFERIDTVATENGIRALLNASAQEDLLEKQFAKMDNDHHRAMFVFLTDQKLFKTAEELLFVDFQTQGKSWQHCFIKTEKEVDGISQDNADTFAFEVANILYRNFDKPEECCAEIHNRFADGSIQISVYINDLPNSHIQVQNRELRRIDTTKAIVAAVVYDPQTKHLATVSKGGKKLHEKIREAFAKNVLLEESEFIPIQPRRFFIDRLASRPQPPMLQTAPEHGIKKVRVRKIEVFSGFPHDHVLSIDTMAPESNASIYDHRSAFDENGKLYSKYAIFHAKLSFHFHPKTGEKTERTLHVSLKKDGSDMKNLKEEDRLMIEGYLKIWGLVEEEECLKTGTDG